MSSGPCRERTGSKLCNTRNTLFSRKSNSAITIGLKWSKSREILWFWSLFVDNENLEILLQWTCYLVMYVWEDKVSKFSSFFSPRHGPLNWHITLSLLLKYHDQYSAKFINTLKSKWTVSDDDPINCKRDQNYEHNVSSKRELQYMNRHRTFVTTSKSILGSIGLELFQL